MNETLSFIRENTKKGLTIPSTALMVSGIDGQPLEYRTLPGAVVAFRSNMTAMELIDTIHALNRCASELFDILTLYTCVRDQRAYRWRVTAVEMP